MTIVPSPHWLGVSYCASEIALGLFKRAKAAAFLWRMTIEERALLDALGEP